MTNEELALRIQSGEQELMEQLWEQVRKLVYWHASRYIKRSTKETNRFDMDDLMQSGYFGVVSAVGYYDPEDGIKFSTYLNWTLV